MTTPHSHENAVSGPCTLATIRDVHAQVWQLCLSGVPASIDVSGVTDVDVTFVQLMVSTARTAEHGGEPFRMAGLAATHRATFEKAGVTLDASGRILTA